MSENSEQTIDTAEFVARGRAGRQPGGVVSETRADRFVRELQELKIPDPAAGRSALWLRLGVVLMVAGPVLAVLAYFMSHGTTDPLAQRDAITLALAGVAAAVTGSALFLRYSLTNFLRFWLARQSHDLDELGSRVVGGGAGVR